MEGAITVAEQDADIASVRTQQVRLTVSQELSPVDLVQSPHGFDLLHRDALNICTWFTSKGVDADGEALFAELLTAAF